MSLALRVDFGTLCSMTKNEDKIDKLARMVLNGFSSVATKEDLAELKNQMATKEDLAELCDDIDVMLDRNIGTFRKDYDELAARVKRTEEAVFK